MKKKPENLQCEIANWNSYQIRSGLRDVRTSTQPSRNELTPKVHEGLRCAISLGSIADMKMKVEISCFTFTNFRDDELLF